MVDFPERRDAVSQFFPACPLCQKKTIITQFCHDWFARDYIVCSSCHARWHLYFLQGLKWAKLIELDKEGKGREYYQIEHKPDFWYAMIKEKPAKKQDVPPQVVRTYTQPPVIVREKEIIKKTQVVTKIKCQYCGKRYDETLDVCPYCGGKP
jgi:formate dehydrogenase maturation protein FdhE